MSGLVGSLEDGIFASSSGVAPFCLLAGSSTKDATLILRRFLLDFAVREGKGSPGCESQGS